MARYDIDSLDNRNPELLRKFSATFGPWIDAYFRPQVTGLERIPSGPALYVGNHNGGMVSPDTFVFCYRLFNARGAEDVPYGLAHDWAVRAPLLRDIVIPLGAIRAGHDNAARLFKQGSKALVYPGGDEDAFRAYSERKQIHFGGRKGYLRLALLHGVPVIPLVTAGAHEVFYVLHHGRGFARRFPVARWLRLKSWPVTLSIPWGLTLGPMPPFIPMRSRIFQEVLEPIAFERSGKEAAADDAYVAACDAQVQVAMQVALDRLYAERDAS